MGGELSWSALPLLFEMVGVEDDEMMIRQLIVLRDELRKESGD